MSLMQLYNCLETRASYIHGWWHLVDDIDRSRCSHAGSVQQEQ